MASSSLRLASSCSFSNRFASSGPNTRISLIIWFRSSLYSQCSASVWSAVTNAPTVFPYSLRLLIEKYPLIDGVSLLDEVPGESFLDNAVPLCLSLAQTEASKKVLRFLPHCIDEGADLD